MKTILAYGAALGLFMCSAFVHAVPRTAFVHLFEWQWDDIAAE